MKTYEISAIQPTRPTAARVGDMLGAIQQLCLAEIRPAPENCALYRPAIPDDPELQRLADSIREHGVIEPLVLTLDGWILSGHRPHSAALLAALEVVPCRVVNLRKADDPDRFLHLLREFNRHRDKSPDEILREEVVGASREAAYASLIAHREKKSRVRLKGIDIRGSKVRSEISEAKGPFLQAIIGVLRERRDFLPLSVRQVHYALLNDPPLKHASKPDSTYKNDLQSYKALDDLLTRARLAGNIGMDAIADETRPFVSWSLNNSVAD